MSAHHQASYCSHHGTFKSLAYHKCWRNGIVDPSVNVNTTKDCRNILVGSSVVVVVCCNGMVGTANKTKKGDLLHSKTLPFQRGLNTTYEIRCFKVANGFCLEINCTWRLFWASAQVFTDVPFIVGKLNGCDPCITIFCCNLRQGLDVAVICNWVWDHTNENMINASDQCRLARIACQNPQLFRQPWLSLLWILPSL